MKKTMRNTLCEFLIVIAAVAKVSCRHGLWLVARVNKNPREIPGVCGYGMVWNGFKDLMTKTG